MARPDGLGPATRNLLQRLRAGEETADVRRDLLLRIERNYLLPLESFLLRAGLPAADRDDVISRIRLALAEGRLRSYDPDRGSFRSWLFYSVARDFIGRHRRRMRRLPGAGIPELATPSDGQGSDVEAAWETSRICHAVLDTVVEILERESRRGGRRAERVRDILMMVWVEGRPPEEAARAMGILQPSVRYHLRRGRRRLLAVLIERLSERDLAGGPFEDHLRRVRAGSDTAAVDGLVRGAARFLLDQAGSADGTTMAIRDRISPRGKGA